MKKILFAIIIACFVCQSGATVESIDKPWKYFLSTMDISMDTALWAITPSVVIPDLVLTNADSGKNGLSVQAFNSVGVGLDFGRYIKSTSGKIYETWGVGLFTLLATDKTVRLGGVIHAFNRKLGAGGGVNLGNVPRAKRFEAYLITGFKLL